MCPNDTRHKPEMAKTIEDFMIIDLIYAGLSLAEIHTMICAGIMAIENMLIAPMFRLCHLKSFSSSYDKSPYPDTLSMILKRNFRDYCAFKSLVLFDD